MSKKIFVTRAIPDPAVPLLREKGYEVDVSEKDGVLTREELLSALKSKPYDGVLALLTDNPIDAEIFDAVPTAKIFANYAVGFNNINLKDAKARGVTITNTPDVVNDTVAEHTLAMMLALACRLVEGDRFMRGGNYKAWDPMLLLGSDLKGKTLGILGVGHIGGQVARSAALGLGMKVAYYDIRRNESLEGEIGALFMATPEEVLKEADVVSIHVPLLDSTHHLINAERLSMMKRSALLINTSRGPVVDESALVEALRAGVIRGAAIDVYENEPEMAPGLSELQNVIITPHIASATVEAREKMGELAARNLIEFFEGRTPPNAVAL